MTALLVTIRRCAKRRLIWQAGFKSVEGISGSPVFDRTANALCGMVVRGGMNGGSCNLIYVDIFDIMRLLEAVSVGKERPTTPRPCLRRLHDSKQAAAHALAPAPYDRDGGGHHVAGDHDRGVQRKSLSVTSGDGTGTEA